MNRKPVTPDEAELREVLRAMAEEDVRLTTPPHVEQSLMHEWDARANIRSSRGDRLRDAWPILAVEASLVLAVALWQWMSVDQRRSALSETQTAPSRAPGASTAVSYESLAWLDTDPASLQIVRLRVPSTTLAAQGYAVTDPDGDGSVEIEMIIGADGAARSVRLDAVGTGTIY
jgi:hypothetical protein